MVDFRKKNNSKYPKAKDMAKVGTYELEVWSGGGYFYDDLLEYRVWVKNKKDLECYSFASYPEAYEFSLNTVNAEYPLALVLQKEYIAEDKNGKLTHVKKERIAEWQIDWLEEGKNTGSRLQDFLEERN